MISMNIDVEQNDNDESLPGLLFDRPVNQRSSEKPALYPFANRICAQSQVPTVPVAQSS